MGSHQFNWQKGAEYHVSRCGWMAYVNPELCSPPWGMVFIRGTSRYVLSRSQPSSSSICCISCFDLGWRTNLGFNRVRIAEYSSVERLYCAALGSSEP